MCVYVYTKLLLIYTYQAIQDAYSLASELAGIDQGRHQDVVAALGAYEVPDRKHATC